MSCHVIVLSPRKERGLQERTSSSKQNRIAIRGSGPAVCRRDCSVLRRPIPPHLIPSNPIHSNHQSPSTPRRQEQKDNNNFIAGRQGKTRNQHQSICCYCCCCKHTVQRLKALSSHLDHVRHIGVVARGVENRVPEPGGGGGGGGSGKGNKADKLRASYRR